MQQQPTTIIQILQRVGPLVSPLVEAAAQQWVSQTVRSIKRTGAGAKGDPPPKGEGCPYCHAVRHLVVASYFLRQAQEKGGDWRRLYSALAEQEVTEAPVKLRLTPPSGLSGRGETYLSDLERLEALVIAHPDELDLIAGEVDHLIEEGGALAEELNAPPRDDPETMRHEITQMRQRIEELEAKAGGGR